MWLLKPLWTQPPSPSRLTPLISRCSPPPCSSLATGISFEFWQVPFSTCLWNSSLCCSAWNTLLSSVYLAHAYASSKRNVTSCTEAFSDAQSRILLLLRATKYSVPIIMFGMPHSNSYLFSKSTSLPNHQHHWPLRSLRKTPNLSCSPLHSWYPAQYLNIVGI